MYSDYSYYLHRLARHSADVPQDVLGRIVTSRQAALGCPVEVEHCPRVAAGEIASPVAFQLAADCRHRGDRDLRLSDPEFFSSAIAKSAPPGSAAHFEIEVAGGGFLNATSTTEFKLSFLTALRSGPFEKLQRLFPVVVEPVAGLDVANVELLSEIRWEVLMREARNAGDDDLNEFLATLGEQLPYPDRLMLLGLLADREISSRSYLRGIAGAQNLPWYFERYESAITTFLETNRTPSQESGAIEEDWLALQLRANRDNPNRIRAAVGAEAMLVRYALAQTELVLEFRGQVLLGPVEFRSIRAMRWGLTVARLFFAFYNHPGNRTLRPGSPGAETVGALTGICADVIRGLNAKWLL